MELAVGVYTPIDPVYAMDSFDPEEAGRKTEQGYFVIEGGEGLTAQEGMRGINASDASTQHLTPRWPRVSSGRNCAFRFRWT